MLYAFGHPIEVTTERVCFRSGADHIKLKQEARADRIKFGFNTDESHVICLRCGKAISLK
jgi:hypothetical protein